MPLNRPPTLRPASIPCPRCRTLVSANADQCISCGLKRPGLYTRMPVLGELIRGDLSFVDGIIVVCALLYLLSLALGFPTSFSFNNIFTLLSPTDNALYKIGMGGARSLQAGRWWTLLTTTYLHGSILHILFNMLWLRQIGRWVDELFGASRFIIIYTVAGLAGSILSAVAGTAFFVGASGAIFGLFGALIYYGRSRGGTFGSAMFRQILIWAVISFAFGLAMPGVDNWGHLGGFAGGILMAWLLSYQEKRRQSLGHHLGAIATLAIIVVCFGMTLVFFFRT